MPPWIVHSSLAYKASGNPELVIYGLLPDLAWAYLNGRGHYTHRPKTVKKARRYLEETGQPAEIADLILDHIIADDFTDGKNGIFHPHKKKIQDALKETKLYEDYASLRKKRIRIPRKVIFHHMAEYFTDIAFQLAFVEKRGIESLVQIDESLKDVDKESFKGLLNAVYHTRNRHWDESLVLGTESIFNTDFTKMDTIDGIAEVYLKKFEKHKKLSKDGEQQNTFYSPFLDAALNNEYYKQELRELFERFTEYFIPLIDITMEKIEFEVIGSISESSSLRSA